MRRFLQKIRRRIVRNFAKKKFLHKVNIKTNEWFFILPYGIGDFYLFLSLLNAFKKEQNYENVSIGLIKPFQSQLLELFDIDINRVIIINESELQFCSKNSLNSGLPIILHPDYFFENSLLSLIGYNGITLNDVYKLMLNLPVQTINEKPVVTENQIIAANKKIQLYNLKENKIVLLSPHANSFDENIITLDFWKLLVDRLNTLGYNIFINSNKKPYIEFENVVPVDFSLSEAIPFVELCKNFIGLRSGFCDLISTAQAKKIILYPSIDWYSGTYFSGSSLKNMKLTDKLIYEFEIQCDLMNDNLNLIINTLAE